MEKLVVACLIVGVIITLYVSIKYKIPTWMTGIVGVVICGVLFGISYLAYRAISFSPYGLYVVILSTFAVIGIIIFTIRKSKKRKSEQARQEAMARAERERQEAIARAEHERQREEREKLQAEQKRQQQEKEEQEMQQKEQERQQIEQEKQRFYDYLVSDSKCQLAIRNFIKQHSKLMENIILDVERAKVFESTLWNNGIDNKLTESIDLLTRALTENFGSYKGYSKQIVRKAIVYTTLKEWVLEFKESNKELCKQINTVNKDERIKLFINYDRGKATQKTIFSYFLVLYNMPLDFNTSISSLHRRYGDYENKRNQAREAAVYENFKSVIFTHIDTNEGGESFTIDDIDGMDGTQFEHYIAKLFKKMGYETEVTKHSGDQGIDVIAKNDIVTIGIQAKCYSSVVGNSAVQEAVGGKALYKVDKVMVITNNEFTTGAKQLAKANNVELWDRSKLQEKVRQYGT